MLLHLREDYKSNGLTINDLDANVFGQFHNWFQDALKAGAGEPNAMTLATSTPGWEALGPGSPFEGLRT